MTNFIDERKGWPERLAENAREARTDSQIANSEQLQSSLAASEQRLAQLQQDFSEFIQEKRRLTRELDVAMHGEQGAAKQASLCDLIGPAETLRKSKESSEQRLKEADSEPLFCDDCEEPLQREACNHVRACIKCRKELLDKAEASEQRVRELNFKLHKISFASGNVGIEHPEWPPQYAEHLTAVILERDELEQRVRELEQALRAEEAVDDHVANCERCSEGMFPELCEEGFPIADDARLLRRKVLGIAQP